MEIDAIGEILNISLGSSATAVSELLGQQVNITTPEVKIMKPKEFEIKTFEPAIGVEINY
ncbi:MAG TPA: flagellar motor switch protein FliN, partial [Ruminococcaceae bacterium]|nr:flagellar motor switch protein FliN [Oscillospiraceae bacterium]